MATGALVLSAAAQESGQAIIFSSPQSADPQAVTPSLAPRTLDLPVLPGTLLAPMTAFPSSSDVAGDRPPPPPVSAADPQRRQQLQGERRNWTLMTPAEIFGVTPADKLLQPERDAFGREKKTTQLERYLDRQNQARTGLTNGWRSDRANSPWNLSRDDDPAGPFRRRLDGTADPAQNLNQFLDRQQDNNAPANQNGQLDSAAFDAFAKQKETQDKLDQLAAMQRFRQMLQPAAAASPDSRFFPAPKAVADPNFTVPDFAPNPAGASFTPLSSSIGRPVGLTPLPGAFTTRPPPVVIPSWKPKPPPWLSESPQTTAFPQQKF